MTRMVSLLATALAGTLLVSATPAGSVDFCANRTDMVKSLSSEYLENPTAVGMIDGNAVIEIFVSEKGSWTILTTSTDGRSCVISAGEGWEINVAALGEGA